MTVYTNLINTAYRLVDKFGQNMTVNVVTDGAPVDASKPWTVSPGTTVSHATRGVMLDFRPELFVLPAKEREPDQAWGIHKQSHRNILSIIRLKFHHEIHTRSVSR